MNNGKSSLDEPHIISKLAFLRRSRRKLPFPDGAIIAVAANSEKFVRWKSKKNSEENS